MPKRSRQCLSVDTLRPHLQAEHGLDVLASLGHPVTGMRLELHRVRVPALDLVTHDPAQRVAQWLRRARLQRPLRGRDHWAHIESGRLKACEGSSFTRPVYTHDRLEEPPVRNLARLRPEISRLARKIEGLPHLLFALHWHVREHQVYIAVLERSACDGDARAIQRVTVWWHPSTSFAHCAGRLARRERITRAHRPGLGGRSGDRSSHRPDRRNVVYETDAS